MKNIIPIIVVVLIAFALIVSFTGILGTYFGKTVENMALGVIALILLIVLLIDKNKKE